MLLILCVGALNGLLCWDFSPINESDGSLRVLVPVAVFLFDCFWIGGWIEFGWLGSVYKKLEYLFPE